MKKRENTAMTAMGEGERAKETSVCMESFGK